MTEWRQESTIPMRWSAFRVESLRGAANVALPTSVEGTGTQCDVLRFNRFACLAAPVVGTCFYGYGVQHAPVGELVDSKNLAPAKDSGLWCPSAPNYGSRHHAFVREETHGQKQTRTGTNYQLALFKENPHLSTSTPCTGALLQNQKNSNQAGNKFEFSIVQNNGGFTHALVNCFLMKK